MTLIGPFVFCFCYNSGIDGGFEMLLMLVLLLLVIIRPKRKSWPNMGIKPR